MRELSEGNEPKAGGICAARARVRRTARSPVDRPSSRNAELNRMYLFLDYLFAVFHGGLVLFNLTGWVWAGTRRIHLAVIGLTLLSWFGLGLAYGWGYCPSTDWHWQVKGALGETDLPYSYVKYYADRLTGHKWDAAFVDAAVLLLGLSAFGLSCWTNWRDWSARRRARCGGSSSSRARAG